MTLIMTYVKALHVGLPNRYPYGEGELSTAIDKKSVLGPLRFTKDGPEGNKPANHTNAVYAFCTEDYQYWNEHLLELAEEAGLAPTFGCRSGTCGLCSTPLTKGDVSYSRKPSIEVPEGQVLLCCSRPVGDIEVDL